MHNIHPRLINWARYWRVGLIRHCCYSIEGRYRSPQEWGDWENERPLPPRPMPADKWDAVLIEWAWARMDNRDSKRLLKFCYIDRRSWWYVKRRLKLTGNMADNILIGQAGILRSLENVAYILRMRDYTRPNNLEYPRLRYAPTLPCAGELRP